MACELRQHRKWNHPLHPSAEVNPIPSSKTDADSIILSAFLTSTASILYLP